MSFRKLLRQRFSLNSNPSRCGSTFVRIDIQTRSRFRPSTLSFFLFLLNIFPHAYLIYNCTSPNIATVSELTDLPVIWSKLNVRILRSNGLIKPSFDAYQRFCWLYRRRRYFITTQLSQRQLDNQAAVKQQNIKVHVTKHAAINIQASICVCARVHRYTWSPARCH